MSTIEYRSHCHGNIVVKYSYDTAIIGCLYKNKDIEYYTA